MSFIRSSVLEQIGVVENSRNERGPPSDFCSRESQLVIDNRFNDALFGIEDNEKILVVFGFHKISLAYFLQHRYRKNGLKGILNTRSPNRPSAIGVTTVKLIQRQGTILTVWGLDALNGSPIYDIKPHSSKWDS